MRRASGLTLAEVLIAFSIVSSALVLIAAGFTRHLAVLQILRGSLLAQSVAESRMLQEVLLREEGVELPEEPLPGGFRLQFSESPVLFEAEPLQGIFLNQATSEVAWNVRGQERSFRLVTGFSADEP